MSGSTFVRAVGLAFRRPGLIPVLLRMAWRFRAKGWYKRPPFLPLPARGYLEWRMHTAFRDDDAVPGTHELERYVEWVRWMRPPTTR